MFQTRISEADIFCYHGLCLMLTNVYLLSKWKAFGCLNFKTVLAKA